MDSPSRTCFVALVLAPKPVDAHITIAMVNGATNREITMLQQDLERLIRPRLPFNVEIGNFRMRGSHGSIPTYDCDFPDPTIKQLLSAFYRGHYRSAPGKRMFPMLEPHITVNTQDKLAFVEALIRDTDGCFWQRIRYLARVPTRSCRTLPPESGYVPNVGSGINFQARSAQSLDAISGDPRSTCHAGQEIGNMQFASRSNCRYCGKPNPGPLQVAYEAPPPSAPLLENPRSTQRRRMDWICPGCGDNQFARNTECRMCTTPRPL